MPKTHRWKDIKARLPPEVLERVARETEALSAQLQRLRRRGRAGGLRRILNAEERNAAPRSRKG